MQTTTLQRVAISMPAGMAAQIDEACRLEGRNRSEFFREAARFYMSTKLGAKTPQLVAPSLEDEKANNPLQLFSEWHSEADAAYDSLR